MVVSGNGIEDRDAVLLSLICLELASPVKLSSLHKEIASGEEYDHRFCARYPAAGRLERLIPGQHLGAFARDVQQRFNDDNTNLGATRYLSPPKPIDDVTESGNVAVEQPPAPGLDTATVGSQPILPRIDSLPAGRFEDYLLQELQRMTQVSLAAFKATSHLNDRLRLATALSERVEQSLPIQQRHFDQAAIAVSFGYTVAYPIALAIPPHAIAAAWPALEATCDQLELLERRVFGPGIGETPDIGWQPLSPLGRYMVCVYGLHGMAVREITPHGMVF